MKLRTFLAAILLVVLSVAPAAAGTECGGQDQFCCQFDTCEAGLACVPAMGGGSVCVPCGAFGEPCCGGECDNAGLACVNDICDDCGGLGLDCCDGTPSCAEDLICDGMDCVQCGQEAGQPCCGDGSEDQCREGLLCDGTVCEACGSIGLQCCDNDTCPDEGTCIEGTCQSNIPPLSSPAPTMGGTGLALTGILLAAIGLFRLSRRRAA